VIGNGLRRARQPPRHGEVPKATDDPRTGRGFERPDEVDLVIINGGINDLDIRYILNPGTSVAELTDDTERVCGSDMENAAAPGVRAIHQAGMRIAVLSYYTVLSKMSKPSFGPQFLDVVGAPMPTMLVAAMGAPVELDAGFFLWIASSKLRRVLRRFDARHTRGDRQVNQALGDRGVLAAPAGRRITQRSRLSMALRDHARLAIVTRGSGGR